MSKTHRKFHGENDSKSRKKSTKGKQQTSHVNRTLNKLLGSDTHIESDHFSFKQGFIHS